MAMISASGASAKWRSDTTRGSTLRNEVTGSPEKNASVPLRTTHLVPLSRVAKMRGFPDELFKTVSKLIASAWFLEKISSWKCREVL
jgi:hypothetical protein